MMKILNLILLSVSLAMDAFSVSLCKGLKLKNNIFKNALVIALFFGVAQAAMPLLGWLCSYKLIQYVEKFDHYIAFAVLAFIGIKMIVDAVRGEEEKVSDKQDLRELALLAVATSLDALAVGVTFSGYTAPAVFASSGVIGLITFVICFIGVPVGHAFGDRLGRPATVAGGCVLILIGIKIMLEGIGIL